MEIKCLRHLELELSCEYSESLLRAGNFLWNYKSDT